MPPIHPAVVHFPIALSLLSVAADIFGFIFEITSLRNTGWWSLLGAAMGGVAAFATRAGLSVRCVDRGAFNYQFLISRTVGLPATHVEEWNTLGIISLVVEAGFLLVSLPAIF